LLADTRSADTRRAYEADLRDFFAFHTGETVTPASLASFCALPSGPLALALNGYKGHLQGRGLAESTVNRRLSAVRSLLRMARRLGAMGADPAGLVTGEKTWSYRDTRGPALSEARRLLAAPDTSTLRGLRDRALLMLLCENALRRGEIHKCDVGDFRPAESRLLILGKGRGSQKEPVTLSPATVAAISVYLAARHSPSADAPLFCNLARFSDGGARLTGRGLLHVVNEYGRRVLGKDLHPHALRHMAITACLDATGGDVRTAQRLSRHADVRTLQRYDDNREDLQGKATQLLSALLHGDGA
jgi:integrase/recombinase XerC